MPGNPPNRAQYTVACTCGVKLTLDARSFGIPKACRGCGGTVTVAWGRDPQTKQTVPVAMTKPPKAKPGARDFIGTCTCGYSRPVSAAEQDKKPRCSGCGKVMTVTIARTERHKSKPSAPLLPLYMRVKAPLRSVVKKEARFFNCVCGLRLTIRPGQQGQTIQCPDCDRAHVVEAVAETAPPPKPRTAAPPPRPAAKPRTAAPPPKAAPPPPPEPAAPARTLKMGEFLCECGEIQPPRTSRTGRDFTCKACGRQGHVETDRDPKTQSVVMRPVFKSGPKAPPKAASPPPPAPVAAEPAPPVEQGDVTFEELSEPLDPFAGAAPATPDEPVFEVAAGSAAGGDAPPAVEPDAQIVPCGCGAEILLSGSDAGQKIRCPACSDMLEVQDHGGKLKLRLIGALEDTDWRLEEFQ